MKGELLLSLYNVKPAMAGLTPFTFSEPRRREIRRCVVCGRPRGSEDAATAYLVVERSAVVGRKRLPEAFPDLIGYCTVRLEVVEQMQAAGITGFRAHPMPWKMEADDLRQVPATEELVSKLPTYCFLEILGRVDVDVFEIDNGEGSVCPGCGLRTAGKSVSYPFAAKRYVPTVGTWDGSDWCRWRNLVNQSPLCSRRVIDLAARHKWTNFLFGESLPGVSIYSPVPEDWFPRVEKRVREIHADLFV